MPYSQHNAIVTVNYLHSLWYTRRQQIIFDTLPCFVVFDSNLALSVQLIRTRYMKIAMSVY